MKGTFSLLFIFLSIHSIGQHEVALKDSCHKDDVHSLFDFVSKGHTSGHIRNYFMATINEGDLKDYWTNAIGGAVYYETAEWKGFAWGVKGIFTYKTFSSDLNEIDTLVGKGAKWEKELYDITRPEEARDLDRLEELFLRYRWGESHVSVGKIDINRGPLLLRRDGRMKPFVFRGAWAEIRSRENSDWYVGLIEGVSPRGMTEWYTINQAIGLSNNGFLYDGTKADYHEAARSKGIAVLGYKGQVSKPLTLQVWNYYFHYLTNVTWTQLDIDKDRWFGGFQYVHQMADPHQSTLEFEKRYYQPNETGNVFTVQAGWKSSNGAVRLSGAYLKALNTGRFLFSKELGRENFYVSQPRSWIDGFGNVEVYQVRMKWRGQNKWLRNLSTDLRIQRVEAPDPDDFQFNKYGRTSYFQSTVLVNYHFKKAFEGLKLTLLYVGRYTEPAFEMSYTDVFYNTNFSHLNVILNVEF